MSEFHLISSEVSISSPVPLTDRKCLHVSYFYLFTLLSPLSSSLEGIARGTRGKLTGLDNS